MVTHRGVGFGFFEAVFRNLDYTAGTEIRSCTRPYPWPPVSSIYSDKPLSMSHTQGRPSANFVLVKGNTLMGER